MPRLPSSLQEARALLERGDFAAAAATLDAACREHPASGEAHFLRGVCWHALGRLDEALPSFERALELDPANLQAAQGAIAVLSQLGRTGEALARGAQLLESAPTDPQLHFNLGLVHESQGDLDRALACYDAALRLDTAYRPALLNRGLALTRLGRLDEAHQNNRRAADLYPALADSHFNLAEVCLALSRYDESIQHCDRALRLDARHVDACFDRGLALAARGRIEEAAAAFDGARAIDPARVQALEGRVYRTRAEARPIDAREVYLVRGFDALDACDWEDRDRCLARFSAWIDDPAPGALDAFPLAWRAVALGIDAPRQARLAARVARRIAGSVTPLAPAVLARSADRIRVGYMSPEFGAHPVASLTQDLYGRHDRGRFEVFAYALTASDGSRVRARIASDVDAFRDVSSLSAPETAARIRADGIHVLVDLGGYLTDARPQVFAMRPAPVNVAYIGYPGTTGARSMDYLIADHVAVPPGAEPDFSERLVFLPDSLWCYGCPPVTDPPPRDAIGLPRDGFVFCAFHNGYKISPEIFSRWMELLRRVAGSVLWVLARRPETGHNLHREARRCGLDARRIVAAAPVAYERHLARQAAADLFLDTPGHSAGTTCLDALWQGLPVLACPTATLAGRQSASALAALGLPELISKDLDDYLDRATRLATDPGALAAVRQRLRAARHEAPLFDMTARVRELEAAFGAMVERARAGLPAASLEIAPGGRHVGILADRSVIGRDVT